MVNVCSQCGEYCAEKNVDINNKTAICPLCGYKNRHVSLPLFIVGGASGTGKTAVLKELIGNIDNAVLMESDIIWQEEFNKPEGNYRKFFETWLRIAKNISQSGKPVAIFGSGFGVPENIEGCIERRYFSNIYYLNIFCSENELEERLKRRPQWRKCQGKEFIDRQKEFNNWIKNMGKKPGIDLLDTTELTIQKSANNIKNWINRKLGNEI